MRYKDIIDYEKETKGQRLARLAVMYGVDDADDRAQEAETDLACARAEKLRADALAAVVRVEAEYDDLVFEADLAIREARLRSKYQGAVAGPNPIFPPLNR